MSTGRRWTGNSREDELLCGLYQQLSERQATQFADGYDVAAGLERYRTFLAEQSVTEPGGPEAIAVQVAASVRAGHAHTGNRIDAAVSGGAVALCRPTQVSMWPGSGTLVPGDGEDAERAVVELYGAHYDSLVRLATLLGSDDSTAELIVQDSFVAMHHAWSSLRDNRKALSYLCQAVVRRSRSARRRRHTLDKIASDKPAAEQCSSFPQEGAVVIEAVRALPAPQREVLVLRFYVDMSEGEIASVMGVSRGAVKSHTARAMQSLRLVLEGD